MKTTRELLDSLLNDASTAHAPSLAEVLLLARREKRRRHLHRGVVGMAACAIVALSAFLAWPRPHEAGKAVAVVRATAPGSFPIQRLDDRQLLEWMGDAPTALASLPDGRQNLIFAGTPVVVPQ